MRRAGSSKGWAAADLASSRPHATSTTSGPPATTSIYAKTSLTSCARFMPAAFASGLISNTQRCLTSFQRHFALEGLFAATLSSSDHGYMKPHPSIFEAALRKAGVTPDESVMVGDSLAHDIAGARRIGMRGVLVARSRVPDALPDDVSVIRTLRELPPLLGISGGVRCRV